MSDITGVVINKKRPARGHKPDCQCGFCTGKGRGKKADNTVASTSFVPGLYQVPEGFLADPPAAPATPPAVKGVELKDAFDRKLDHFQYTLDPEEAAVWEHDESLSPLHVPKNLRDRYPHLAWRWVSKLKLDSKGVGYNGWQLFNDGKSPEGVRRGNDLQLAAMPKEMAESYRRRVSERSTEAVRNIQEKSIGKMEKALSELRDPNASMLSPGDSVAGRSVDGTVEVGRRGRVGLGGGYHRGVSREEVHEQIAKSIEERRKNKVYSFQGSK